MITNEDHGGRGKRNISKWKKSERFAKSVESRYNIVYMPHCGYCPRPNGKYNDELKINRRLLFSGKTKPVYNISRHQWLYYYYFIQAYTV